MKKILTTSPEETIAFAKRFSKILSAGDIICMYGDLGAGKTTFTKGLAEGLNVSANKVTSPTFVLMNIYEGKLPIYHFDLYRIEAMDMLDIGYDEFLYGGGVAIIEWSERLDQLLPKERFEIYLKHQSENKRSIVLKAFGKKYQEKLTAYSV